MFKMVKRSASSLPLSTLAALCFLVVCLAGHFLVEDFLFQFAQPVSITGQEELTHQDDLALSSSLPERLPVARVKYEFPAILPARIDTNIPHRHPPKTETNINLG